MDEESSAELLTCRERAEGGESEAQFGLGFRCAARGGETDYEEAAGWYRKAAVQSHPLAQFNLGIMYSKGQGVPRDKAISLRWMGSAAELGDAGAQYEFGMRQHRLSLDLEPAAGLELRIEAYKWLLLAAAQDYAESVAGCETVAMDLTHPEVLEGRHRAQIFVPVANGKRNIE